jgi:hypothetical protein
MFLATACLKVVRPAVHDLIEPGHHEPEVLLREKELKIPRSTAGRWISLARRSGISGRRRVQERQVADGSRSDPCRLRCGAPRLIASLPHRAVARCGRRGLSRRAKRLGCWVGSGGRWRRCGRLSSLLCSTVVDLKVLRWFGGGGCPSGCDDVRRLARRAIYSTMPRPPHPGPPSRTQEREPYLCLRSCSIARPTAGSSSRARMSAQPLHLSDTIGRPHDLQACLMGRRREASGSEGSRATRDSAPSDPGGPSRG